MRKIPIALIGVTLVTASVYAVLVTLGMRHLVLGVDALLPFDLRPMGYSFLDATAYLSILPPEVAVLYTGLIRRLDTVFPLLFGLWMGMVYWRSSPWMHPWSRIILLIAPASYTIMDLVENALVSEMVTLGMSAISPEVVNLASSYTISKFVTVSVAFSVMLVMIFLNIRNRGRVGKRR